MVRKLGCWLLGIILIIALGVLIIVLLIRSGTYNVAATYPDPAPVAWLLSSTMDHSVRRHARGIKVPPLDDPAMIRAGAQHYRDDCVICHGAPGAGIGEVGRGLNPKPPELVKVANDWKPNELFWITKNGVRMTGMPAWGKIDSDDELWQTTAFVRKMPNMTPAQYKNLSRETSGANKP